MTIPKSTYIQIGVWLSLFAIPTLIFGSLEKPTGFYFFLGSRLFLFAAFFNLNLHVVAPLFFSGRKRAFWVFIGLLFLLYMGASVAVDLLFISKFGMSFIPPHPSFVKPTARVLVVLPTILSGLLVFGISAALAAFSAFEKKKSEEEAANRRRLEAELSLLKSQINPHFLLNTLNNLYAIALTAPEKTPDGILKLSEMVTYILYECDKKQVPIAHDLAFIENYLALQRLRLPPNAVLHVEMPPAGKQMGQLEPMLLIPFIENAFKHGLTTKKPCEIYISIQFLRNILVLHVENDVFSQISTEKREESGIGLSHTRQRLEHSYANTHTLKIENDGSKHCVELTLHLDLANTPTHIK